MTVQREIVRLHELWQKAKRELAVKDAECTEWRDKYQRLASSELSRSQARKFQELEGMTMEFKDKLRFMVRGAARRCCVARSRAQMLGAQELQLASAREENERWSNSYEEVVRELEQQKHTSRQQAADIEVRR